MSSNVNAVGCRVRGAWGTPCDAPCGGCTAAGISCHSCCWLGGGDGDGDGDGDGGDDGAGAAGDVSGDGAASGDGVCTTLSMGPCRMPSTSGDRGPAGKRLVRPAPVPLPVGVGVGVVTSASGAISGEGEEEDPRTCSSRGEKEKEEERGEGGREWMEGDGGEPPGAWAWA